ncbi:MAG TPA: lamin tail domain-containing protein [Mycobacteriales bacterium]|jgi:hypothetical protein
MRTRTAALLTGLLAVLATTLPAQAGTAATSPVQIKFVYYDSPGRDDRSNASLDAEFVQLHNGATRAVSLRSWTLRDTSSHIYVFGAYTLGAGKTVSVRTGRGTDSAIYRYQGRRAYVWNNDKDTAILRNASGTTVDSCRWTRPGTGKISC